MNTMAANWDNRLGRDPEFNLILYIDYFTGIYINIVWIVKNV